ncbi:hypothetical protein K7X08_027251 [Anisodus acutangulus]|uniref:Uncharacterized protein n=1 Tax=Anisodus acutangulus TaxID=402998 RepID=A0A9Q1RLD4_9SOLA|nr:hypothetical protein K7X08_027251 [Anisodus acutangulus]
MKVYAIVFIVIASVAFTACNLLCCLCTGRGGRFKKPKLGTDDVETGTKKATTRDGNMVVLAGAGGAATAVTSNDKRARDHKKNTNSGGCGAAVGGGCGGGCGGCGGREDKNLKFGYGVGGSRLGKMQKNNESPAGNDANQRGGVSDFGGDGSIDDTGDGSISMATDHTSITCNTSGGGFQGDSGGGFGAGAGHGGGGDGHGCGGGGGGGGGGGF